MLVAIVISVYLVLVLCLVRAVMRIMPKRFIKTLFLGSFLCFIVVNMNLFLHTGDERFMEEPQIGPVLSPRDDSRVGLDLSNQSALRDRVATINQTVIQNRPPPRVEDTLLKPKQALPEKYVNRTLESKHYVPLGSTNLTRINQYIHEANQRQQIFNLDTFDLLASDNAVVIVVQVHNRIDYLRYLIDSLAKAKDIHQTLLIFSHDWFDDEMNQLVRSVDFCPVSVLIICICFLSSDWKCSKLLSSECSRHLCVECAEPVSGISVKDRKILIIDNNNNLLE